jgi:hypothetical protein
MKQQVNLYQEQFHEKHVELPARQIAIVLGGLLAGMVLVNLALALTNARTATQLTASTATLEQLKTNNDTLQQRLDTQKVDPALEAAVAGANRQLQARRHILQWVDRSQSKREIIFSAMLEGLGRQHVQGLWLTEIDILNSGDDLNLRGSTVNPKLLPEFIGRLKNEPAYVGREFRRVTMSQQDETNILNFMLTTRKSEDTKLGLAAVGGRTQGVR